MHNAIAAVMKFVAIPVGVLIIGTVAGNLIWHRVFLKPPKLIATVRMAEFVVPDRMVRETSRLLDAVQADDHELRMSTFHASKEIVREMSPFLKNEALGAEDRRAIEDVLGRGLRRIDNLELGAVAAVADAKLLRSWDRPRSYLNVTVAFYGKGSTQNVILRVPDGLWAEAKRGQDVVEIECKDGKIHLGTFNHGDSLFVRVWGNFSIQDHVYLDLDRILGLASDDIVGDVEALISSPLRDVARYHELKRLGSIVLYVFVPGIVLMTIYLVAAFALAASPGPEAADGSAEGSVIGELPPPVEP